MPKINVRGIHHLGLRVSDIGKSREFYTQILGLAVIMEGDGFCIVDTNGTPIGLLGPSKDASDRFDPFRVGVNHLAFAVPGLQELERIKQQLDAAGVKNNGLEFDPALGGTYVSFHDPDGIAWEAYVMPGGPQASD